MALSGQEMMSAVAKTMKEKTGRSLEEWVAEVAASGPDPLDQVAVRKWLRDTHRLTQPSQWAIALEAAKEAGWREPTVDEKVDEFYSGKKAGLRPVHDRLFELVTGLGGDIEVMAGGSYVAFARKRQFAAIQPATATRVDLGLRFVEAPESDLLKPTKGLGQCTHKVGLTTESGIDGAVKKLLRLAYDQNG